MRGRKCSPWDGGTRTVAFVSGGFIPAPLRGTKSDVLMHVVRRTNLLAVDGCLLVTHVAKTVTLLEQADWYATVAKLAGVDAHDVVQIGGGSHDIDVRRSLVTCVKGALRL